MWCKNYEIKKSHTGDDSLLGQSYQPQAKMSKNVLILNQDAINYFNPKPKC
jgi:hypothetical protein